MMDYKIRAIVQTTMTSAGAVLAMPTCSLEARMRIAIGVESAMSALWMLADDVALSRDIDFIRREAYSAAWLYGLQYAEAMSGAA